MLNVFKNMFGSNKKEHKGLYKKTILAVEDNEVDRRLIKSILDKKYDVVMAENGETGLKAVKKLKPDLVLLDCEMPVMTGNEMCRIMKDDNSLKEIPVLFLTSVNTPANIIECFELDAENHLSKPIKPKVLLGQVDAILSTREVV